MFKKVIKKTKDIIFSFYLVYFSKQKGFHKEEIRLRNTYYTNNKSNMIKPQKKTSIIFMIDGRSVHGGLSDRLRGICSIYEYCKEKHIPFYLNAIYPFKLQDYLEPNIVNWSIKPEEILYDLHYAIPVCINDYQLSTNLHQLYLNKLTQNKKQIHIYSNTQFNDFNYTKNFNELFKPSPKLQEAINNNLQRIRYPYIAMVLRFQQLLGDFKEDGYKVLPKNERTILINKCIDKIKYLHDTFFIKKQILVTADSITFLNKVNELDFITIIPGKIVHMDHTQDESFDVYMKSFIDMFMLSKAEKIFLLQTDAMYHSGFAKRAAMINNTPYGEIIF